MIESPASKENERVGTNWMLQVQLQPNKHHCKSASDLLLYTQNAPFTAQPYGHRFDPKTPEENRVRMSPKHSGPLASRIWVGHIWVFPTMPSFCPFGLFCKREGINSQLVQVFPEIPHHGFLRSKKIHFRRCSRSPNQLNLLNTQSSRHGPPSLNPLSSASKASDPVTSPVTSAGDGGHGGGVYRPYRGGRGSGWIWVC